MANQKIQIDVKGTVKGNDQLMDCYMYTEERCVKIYMTKYEYELLINDGFFIRDGKSLDSANVLNTTNTFIEKP